MTPADAIAALDRRLAAAGQTVTLRRVVSGTTVTVDLRAAVRMTGASAPVGTAELKTVERDVVFSPSSLGTWPGALAQSDGTDPKVPRPGDDLIVNGRRYEIREATPIYVDDVLCRIELRVRG